ncbi:MAG: CRISPR-associated protein Cas5 [Thermodesulfobacteriota bacterium]
MLHAAVSMEVSGPTAMWTRPDTGDAPVSYPVPTFGAIKGIFECILWSQWAEVVPTRVEVCGPIVYHTYTTNYRGPLRESKVMKKGSSFQLLATVMVNVCYRLYADVQSDPSGYHKHGRPGKQVTGTTNGAHAYKDVFERRLRRGEFFSTPFLGWKEFLPDYVGPFRPETSVCEDIDLVIPSMLKTCFPTGKSSEWTPLYHQNVRIEKGVLRYAQ